MKPMRICHVLLSLDVGGLERNVLNQVRCAPGIGEECTVVCLERPGELAPQVRALGARVISMGKRAGLRPGMVRRLRNVFRDLLPDVVHTHQIGTLLYAGPAAKWAGVPLTVHTEHGKEPYQRRWRTRMLGRVAGTFTHTFFCLTEDMASQVRASRVVPNRKIRVIFNGIDTSQFTDPCETSHVGASLGIPPRSKVIGTVGRLTEIKRQDVLIRAFAKVKARFESAHLLLVGDGPLRERLEELAVSLGIGGSVHFAGYQSPTAPYIQIMTIFALTSRSEGMPQAAIEASVTGLPVVASRVGGLPELIEQGRTGLLVPEGDDSGFAEAFCRLLEDPASARRMGEAARQHAIARFDIGRMAADYHSYFAGLLDRPSTPIPVGTLQTSIER
jgi:sugar transferase (PEP-CTERM/EpsH1 system associated)